MSTRILFPIRRKILTCVLVALTLLLFFSVIGVGYSQSPSPQETQKMKSIQIINPRPPFSLKLWLDQEGRATYQAGERIVILFQASQDSFVRIYSYDSEGRVKIIFPNQYSPHDFVRAGETRSIEGIIDANTTPGIEYVQGFATTHSITFSPREEGLISKQFMPEVSPDYNKYTQTIRGIIASIPPAAWTSSNLLSYTVRPIPPPPTNYGRIIVHSKPNKVKVYLDNTYQGTTPLNLDRISPGQHRISFVMDGYRDQIENISVSPSRTTTVSGNLVPIPEYGTGSISVYSNIDGANIYLDGNYQRRTSAKKDVELKDIKQGYHELLITKEGYLDWVSTIVVTAHQTQTVDAYLDSEISAGSIEVYSNVSKAKIFVNGTYQAATVSSQPITLEEMEEGIYEITLVNDGYKTWVEEVWVYAGETTPLDVKMDKITTRY